MPWESLVANQTGKRVLIVEDEALVAMHLEDILTAMGYDIAGTASRVEQAVKLAREEDIDFAILDVNLAGSQSFPVAAALRERDIPFVFATGYGIDGLIDGYRHETVLLKPYEAEDLADAIARAAPAITR